MDRGIWAVSIATFVLRFATGLTGALLVFFWPTCRAWRRGCQAVRGGHADGALLRRGALVLSAAPACSPTASAITASCESARSSASSPSC
jgi:hypothetical protein